MIASIRYLAVALLALTGLTVAPAPARAETFHTCAGFVDTLPATISTQGVWCLRKDLSTAITTGNAITINTNNVTIDCNGFKLGGLQAGDSSQAYGIRAENRLNATVRNCNIRGFLYGVSLFGAGHLVTDNRFEQNLFTGIWIGGENNLVRRNQIHDTGGYPSIGYTVGINAAADIIDNTVAGVTSMGNPSTAYGIYMSGSGHVARGNHVRALVSTGTASFGIDAPGGGAVMIANRISSSTPITGNGISGAGSNTVCSDNSVINFSTAYSSCDHTSNNLPSSGGGAL